jgi:hypothetical protein
MSERCLVCSRECGFKRGAQIDLFFYEWECEACGTFRANTAFDMAKVLGSDVNQLRLQISRHLRLRNQTNRQDEAPSLSHYFPDGYKLLPRFEQDVPATLDALLNLVAEETKAFGETVDLLSKDWQWVAMLCLTNTKGLKAYLDELDSQALAVRVTRQVRDSSTNQIVNRPNVLLTMKGWERVRELRKTSPTLSNRVFCAFPNRNTNSDEDRIISQQSTDLFAAIQVPVQPLIPYRVEADHQATQINDAIVAGLRGARFVIADLSHHRPNVYYEAGFAQGLGTPVVFICRSDLRDKTHFDVASHRILEWSPETLPAFAQELKVHLQARALLP